MVIYRAQGHSRSQKHTENNFFAKPDMVITMLKHSFVETTGLIKNCFDITKQNELNTPARYKNISM